MKVIRPVSVFPTVLLLVVAMDCFAQTRSEAEGEVALKRIDGYIAEQMKRVGIPGVALAIVQRDTLLYSRGFGVADPSGRPVTADTPFVLGSTTKSFTAMAVMQLVESGQIHLDTPVQTYLPWFRVADPEASSQMTVRHLLNHSSGLSESEGRQRLADPDTSAEALERHVRDLDQAQLITSPGSSFEYSNSNYSVLGLIVQEVTGLSFEHFVKENIFIPLEMSQSFASQREAEKFGLATGHRKWYGFSRPAVDMPFVRGVLPAGYVISSAKDLANYLIAHLNDGSFRNQSLLSPDSMTELHRPAARMTDELSYGMGWVVEDEGEYAIIWHNGGVPNFYSYMAIVPARDLGLVVLMNIDDILNIGPIEAVPVNVLNILLNRELVESPGPGPKIFAYVVLGLVLIGQLLWIGFSIFRKRLLTSGIGSGKGSRRKVAIWLARPLLLNAIWACFIILLLRGMSGVPLAVAQLYAPDLALLFYVSASVALLWGMLQCGSRLRAVILAGICLG